MKHLLLSTFSFAILFLTLPCQAQNYDFSAEAPSGQTLYYNIVNGGAQLAHTGSGAGSLLIIPDTVTYNGIGYPVTSIGEYALAYTSLSSVTIPNTVTSIENHAFRNSTSLSSVTIPNSVTHIGYCAFGYCSSLTGVTIPNSVTSIEENAFAECTSLTSVTLPNTITTIGRLVFSNCTSLTSVTIPNSVNTIEYSAFMHCTSLTSVTIPNSVISIEGYAFGQCTSLTSVTIPSSVTSIEGDSFAGDTSIVTLVVSSGNPVFDSRNNCNAIIQTDMNLLILGCKTTTIPNSVTHIGYYAFAECTSLTRITIPNSVRYIGSYAFAFCASLTSVTIPNSVTDVENDAFSNCLIDTLNMGHYMPFVLETGNTALSHANIINIPCGATANYQNRWGTGNYHEPDPAVLTLSVSDNNGIVAIESQNTQQSTLCVGSTAVIQATANYGYHFVQWNDGNTANPRTITLTQDTAFTAQFGKNQYTLNISSNDTAMGSVTGGGTYEYLDTVTLRATTTAAHHHFGQWSDGVTDTVRTIIVTSNLSLTAIFAIDMHQVTLTVNDVTYGYVLGDGQYPYGSTVDVVALPYNGYYFRGWDNGVTNDTIVLTLTQDTSFAAFFAPAIVPSLCMVSVENDHNMLMWEKEQTVAGYNIYREGNTSGVYEQIATIPYDSLSTWVDTSSRPRTRSYRYRLSAIDVYGHEADLSDIHKTMHLTINQGMGNQWNLVWTEYEGADYTTYVIYRGTDPSNLQIIDIMPSGGNSTYTDDLAPAGDVFYQVGIMLTTPCNPTKSENVVLSNVATNSTTGIFNVIVTDLQVFAYNGQLVVSGECHIKDVQIYDISGKLLKTAKVDGNNTVVDISDFATGIYIVCANTANGPVTRKVVR